MSKLSELAEAIKLEHTIFALPFAYLGLWVAAHGNPAWRTVGWVTLAMVGARTAGMALNRLIDLPLDRLNPRTKNWPVPSGRVKPPLLIVLTLSASGLLFLAASQLNRLCLSLAPLALGLMFLYPHLKRFTWACHFGLGAVLGLAPVGGWFAVTGHWDRSLLPLFYGVLMWVAGFDILYALLDLDFDRRHGVYSIPRTFGLKPSLNVASLCHFLAVMSFAWFGVITDLGRWFWVGLILVAGLLLYEHRLVRPARLDRINRAFFTVNGWVSVSLFLFTLIDLKFPR